MPTVDLTRIGSNIGALYSLKSLLDINNKLATTQQHLSTGKRINSASDDPAGLVIATKMNARSEGLKVVQDNISDATNMMSVAESGLNQLTDIVTQMRSKATQAANDTLGSTERAAIQTQLQQFSTQIDDILASTKWNGVQLLKGSLSKQFQTGVDAEETTTWTMNTNLASGSAGLGLSDFYTSSSATNLTGAIGTFTNLKAGGAIGLSELNTGHYSLKVLDQGGGSGVVNSDAVYMNGISAITGSGITGSSGNYTMKITGVFTGGSVNYDLVDNAGKLATVSGSLNATSTVSQFAGNGIAVTTGGSLAAFAVGNTMTFEFIAAGDSKLQLMDGGGQAVSITNKSGSPFANAVYSAAGPFDTGRGITATIAGGAAKGDTVEFDYHQRGTTVDVSTAAKANAYVDKANSALDTINSQLATLGSLMARMTIKGTAASSAQINVEAAYNRIMNANMAEEQVNASKYQVLQQTSVAMLAQSNQAPQSILSLFK